MGRLDEIVVTLSDLFDEYNNDDDKKKRLDKDEIGALLENEVNIDNFQIITKMLKQMDKNKDDELKLKEFGNAVTQLAILYYHRNKPGGEV
uniref:EF-hand domain-containing protein n=1 Tax=Hippocampus comes TaxID=109280 RepID=A0A3Q3D8P8_HIPCM